MNTSGLHVSAGSRRWQQAVEGAEVWAVNWDDLLSKAVLCGYAAYCACDQLAKHDLWPDHGGGSSHKVKCQPALLCGFQLACLQCCAHTLPCKGCAHVQSASAPIGLARPIAQ
jgi:hypothetical protein